MNRLEQLHDAGVSIWLDTLSRELLDSGAFAALIAGSAVTGATSNPTIFAKAITGSDAYDDQLRAAIASDVRDPQELFFALALDDVGRAADLLRPAYDASDGGDGFVSFECTPDLADDTAATVEQALALWGRLARPNVMIKVPATAAGIPAIEALTARGVNVNVTLLFSVERYEQVIDAYVAGLERRVARGEPVDADRLGRLLLRLARRREGGRRAPARLGPARPRRDRQRAARLRALPRALRRRALAGPARRRRSRATTAVGQHRNQGPRLLRRALRRGADRPRRRQHDARGHAARLRRPRSHQVRPQRQRRRGRGGPPRRRARGRRPRRGHRATGTRGRAVVLRLPTASCSTASRRSQQTSRAERRNVEIHGANSRDDKEILDGPRRQPATSARIRARRSLQRRARRLARSALPGVRPDAAGVHGRADRVRPRQVLQRHGRLAEATSRRGSTTSRPARGQQFMYFVGVTEILAGVIVALKPRYGAYVVAAWLAGIVINLLTYSGFYDIALRDFGLMLAALTPRPPGLRLRPPAGAASPLRARGREEIP